MNDLKHTQIGITSVILILIVVINTIIPVLYPLNMPYVIPSVIEILAMTMISLLSFILGLVAMFQKGSKKLFPKIAIIISGIFLIPVVVGLAKGIFLRLTI
ncbi:hypothetical protein [Clostridium botulinum]|uniref:hypothetical protein n=1 Tax=Clostridium botulinum TaxID=1491 RepID=UPI000772E3F4|nr:hypothetical protein [Clostridium botulinum]